MKVILLQDVKGTGKKDQIVEASDGFARNYLIPRKMAREATAEALNAIEKSKSADKHREDVRRAEAETKARRARSYSCPCAAAKTASSTAPSPTTRSPRR